MVVTAPIAVSAAEPYGLVPDDDTLRELIGEPFFAFVFRQVESDSLGTWTGGDVQDFAADWERPSDFPLDVLVSLTREAPPAAERPAKHGVVCGRRIVLDLDHQRLDVSMPYSILGYHPGTLGFGSPLVLREWRLGEREINIHTDAGSRREKVSGLTVFQIVGGWVVLDVDGWLDGLLGNLLDDTAIMGFVVGRVHDRILGLAVCAGRSGRLTFGELDFEQGTVSSEGHDLARALVWRTRHWTLPDDGDRSRAWGDYD
jgi:hypothetical protein